LDGISEKDIKWKANEDVVKITSFKYKVQKLKAESPYAIRVRAKNVSGWSLYSAPLIQWTEKLTIPSKILKAKEKSQLLKMIPKGKKIKMEINISCNKRWVWWSQFSHQMQ